MKKRALAFVYLLLVSIIWGAASPVVKHTLQWLDPWLFLTYRFGVSTLIALPYLGLARIPFPKKTPLLWLVSITGLISAPVSLFLFFSALDKTTALSGSLITAVGPLFLILGGVLFFRDRITKNEKTGIAVAVTGTILTVVGPLILNGHADTLGKIEGNTLMLFAVMTDVVGALLSKEAMKKGVHPTLVAQTQFILGFVIYLPILFLMQPGNIAWATLVHAPWQAHAGVWYMAVISGTIAYTLRNMAVKSIEVSESALYSYLQPLWAAILAILWLGERITVSYIIGGFIIAAGVGIAESKNGKHKR